MFDAKVLRRLAVAVVAALISGPAAAQDVTAPGYIYSFTELSDTTQSCVASATGGTFVGVGEGFTGNGQSVAFVTESGVERTVVSGFNSIGDCVYDAVNDQLYVVDNGLEALGAVTGDTAYAIPGASTATNLTAGGFNLAPSGSIPSAFSVALDAANNVFVSDAVGAGLGNVRKIAASNGALTTLIPGFDFTGGVAIDDTGDIFVAESLASLASLIGRYNSAGVFEAIVSGPSTSHGSYDLAFNTDGRLLATGKSNGPVVSIDPATGNSTNLATGFAFPTSIDVDDFTGRIQLVSSTFTGDAEDFRLHSLTPIALIVPDSGGDALGSDSRRDCVGEFYGLELSVNSHDKTTKRAICTDGAACDADGEEDGKCTFRFGVCLNVTDPRVPNCLSEATVDFSLRKAKPDNTAVTALVTAIQDALPVAGPQCFFSDGVEVPLRVTSKGLKSATQVIKIRSDSEVPFKSKDSDVVNLVCDPPSSDE
jgi:hypothetical protein